MIFPSSLLVLSLGLFAAASPTPAPETEIIARDTFPNASVAPLTVFTVFQMLKVAVDALLPGLETIIVSAGPAAQAASVVPRLAELTEALNTATNSLASLPPGAAGASDEDIAKLVEDILNSVNTALNRLVPKLGLNGLLAPLDGALTGLLTTLDGILPPVLALVGRVLIPVGGIVGGLFASLNLAGL